MGVKERREREKENRKRGILSAAQKVFYEKGFQNATIEEIATCCELSVGTLYLYFKSKEEMYVSLLFESIEHFTKEISKIEQEKSPSSEKVKKIWDYFYVFYKKNPKLFKIVMFLNNSGLSKTLSKDTVDAINKISGKNFSALENILRQCIKDGSYKKADEKELSFLIWSLFIGVISFAETRENLGLSSNLKAFHARTWDRMEKGLRT